MKIIGGSRLTTKSQVTIPKQARDALSLRTGDLIVFVYQDGEILLKRGHVEVEGVTPLRASKRRTVEVTST